MRVGPCRALSLRGTADPFVSVGDRGPEGYLSCRIQRPGPWEVTDDCEPGGRSVDEERAPMGPPCRSPALGSRRWDGGRNGHHRRGRARVEPAHRRAEVGDHVMKVAFPGDATRKRAQRAQGFSVVPAAARTPGGPREAGTQSRRPVTRRSRSRRDEAAMSSTARSNASAFARDGRRNPLTLRTNWRAAARISSSVAGCTPRSCLMLRHIVAHHSGPPLPGTRRPARFV